VAANTAQVTQETGLPGESSVPADKIGSQGADRADTTLAAQNSVGHAARVREQLTTQRWLAWLTQLLTDVDQLALLHVETSQPTLSGLWPTTPNLPPAAVALAVRAVENTRPAVASFDDAAERVYLALPLQIKNRLPHSRGQPVLVVANAASETAQLQTLIQLCHWASYWLSVDVPLPAAANDSGASIAANTNQSADGKPPSVDSNRSAVSDKINAEQSVTAAILDALAKHRSVEAVAFAVVNGLAQCCACERVSLGVVSSESIEVVAVSGQSSIDKRREVIQQLNAAMAESVTYQQSLIYPKVSDEQQLAEHARLFVQNQRPMLTLRLPNAGTDKLIVLLERSRGNRFKQEDIVAFESMFATVAPMVSLLEEARVTPVQRLVRYWQQLQLALRERRIAKGKLFCVAAVVALVLAAWVPIPHRVTARAAIEAADRQVLVAPQSGYVKSAHARAGEHVEAGQLLATLDDRELSLEADKWRSEHLKNQQEYAAALATHERTELSRLRADAVRISAELALIEQQLSRSELRAPFDGVLLSGDLSQSLGAPVQAGDVLFEVASADRYRLVLDVDERDVGFVAVGQAAELRMAALPDQLWQAELEDVLPVAVVEQGSSVFRLPARVQSEATSLRPGMQGIGKIRVGSRSMLWVYTHSLLDRLRLFGWKWGLLS